VEPHSNFAVYEYRLARLAEGLASWPSIQYYEYCNSFVRDLVTPCVVQKCVESNGEMLLICSNKLLLRPGSYGARDMNQTFRYVFDYESCMRDRDEKK